MRSTIFFCVLCFFISGCTKKTRDPDILSVRLKADPVTLDWNKATDTPSRLIIFNLMDPLVDLAYDQKGVHAVPGLVTKWTSLKGGQTYRIWIQEGLKWSDGEPFVAQHVYDSFERLLNPKTGAFNSFLYYVIKGAKSYNTGDEKDFKKVGLKITGPHSLEFRLERKFSAFPKLLALFNILPIRKDLIKKHGDHNWWKPEHLVTLGPYQLSFESGLKKFQLKKNPHYTRKPLRFKSVDFFVIEEDPTAISLFESGRLDLMEGLPSELIPKISQKKEYRKVENLAIEYLGFNTKKSPFDKVEYRKALSCAIDYSKLKKILSGGELVNRMFLPKGLEGYDPDFQWNCLQAAPPHSPKKDVKLTYYTDENQKKLIEFFQYEIKKALGWSVEVINQEWKVYIHRVNHNPPMVYRLGWLAILPDPTLYLSLFSSQSHFNSSGWKNKEYDRIYNQVQKLPPSPQRARLIQRANEILVKEHRVVIPLHNGVRHYLVSEKLQNIKLDPLARLFVKDF